MNPDALRVTADEMQRGVLLPCGAVYKQIRDAAEKIERLRAERDEAREVAADLYRCLSYHEAVPEIDENHGWLIEAAEKERGE